MGGGRNELTDEQLGIRDLWIIRGTWRGPDGVLAELWFISVLDGRGGEVRLGKTENPGSLNEYFNFCCWLLIIWIIYVYK